MTLHYGTFSYLPPLTDDEIAAQVKYALDNGWPVSIEYTDDPHPRNVYWEMWGLPMFDLAEPDGVLAQINECRAAYPEHYIRVLAYDARLGKQTTAMSLPGPAPVRGARPVARASGGARPRPAVRREVLRREQAGRIALRGRVTRWNSPKDSGCPGRPRTSPGSLPATAADEPAEPVTLADDAELDLSADEAAARVDETLAALDAELVGLASVKRRVREIASLLQVDRARQPVRAHVVTARRCT